ncbi:MAG: CCA tRNA nucleotidyltransferase [Acidobacteria bacterium]|nr:CCA tRNA nucleotidyltransferase [Acidobacteriota bacterium]
MTRTSAGNLARRIVASLRARGFQAWLVGGCVRDLLLGLEPADYDVATDARPETVQALFPDARLVGAHFGVVLVSENGAEVEVATFRSDHAYRDGRRPDEVRYETDPREDVRRRDFTINALLMDPETGEVADLVGGRRDLAAGLIRAIGDPGTRFREDHLRLLRAVRFAARFGFAIEGSTLEALRRERASIRGISAERIRGELTRILTEGGARRGFELLNETGLLDEVLPEAAATKGVAQPPEFHPEGDVWIHTLLMLEALRNPTATLAWGVLLHDIGKPPTFRVQERIRFDGHVEAGGKMAAEILARLRFSTGDARQIEALIAHHLRFKDLPRMRESKVKRFLRMDRFEEHLELHRLDCLSSHRNLENYEFALRKLAETPAEVLKPRRLLTGHDLIRMGYQPGPAFARILAEAEDAQLESAIRTPEQAAEFVRARFAPPEGLPSRSA